jgi:hypothetical protein
LSWREKWREKEKIIELEDIVKVKGLSGIDAIMVNAAQT